MRYPTQRHSVIPNETVTTQRVPTQRNTRRRPTLAALKRTMQRTMRPTIQGRIQSMNESTQQDPTIKPTMQPTMKRTMEPTMQQKYKGISSVSGFLDKKNLVPFPRKFSSRLFEEKEKQQFLKVANKETDYTKDDKRIRAPSEKLNYIKRIWMVAKDVTHKLNFDDVIAKYQKILKLDINNLSDDDLKLFVVPKERARTWKNYLTLKTLRGKKYTGQYKIPNLTQKNRIILRDNLTVKTIRNYQLNAYNELIGIMIILMEKARDKYTAMSIIKTLGTRRLGFRHTIFSKGDSGGIIHIDNLTEDYVQSIFGYNLDERLNDIYMRFKNTNNNTLQAILILLASIGILTFIAALGPLFDGYYKLEEPKCPEGSEYYSSDTTRTGIFYYTCKTLEAAKVGFNLGSKFTVIGKTTFMPPLVNGLTPLVDGLTISAEQLMGIALGHGIPTAIILSYKMYKMYRGYKRKTLLKDIFINIHEAIFNKENTLQFERIKDELFIYNDVLSKHEQTILSENGPNIDSKTKDKEMYNYTNTFLNARKDHLELLAKAITERLALERGEIMPSTEYKSTVPSTKYKSTVPSTE